MGRLPGAGARDLRGHRAALAHRPRPGAAPTRSSATCAGASPARRRCSTARWWCWTTRGGSDFNALQNGRGPFTYVAFDLLHARRALDLRPALERAARAARADASPPEAPPRLIAQRPRDATATGLFEAAAEHGARGDRGQARRRPYRPGRRVREWVKVKARPEMAGVDRRLHRGRRLAPRHARRAAGGRAGRGGRLTYLSHVGCGFSPAWPRRAVGPALRNMEVAAVALRQRRSRSAGRGPAGCGPSCAPRCASLSGRPTTACARRCSAGWWTTRGRGPRPAGRPLLRRRPATARCRRAAAG